VAAQIIRVEPSVAAAYLGSAISAHKGWDAARNIRQWLDQSSSPSGRAEVVAKLPLVSARSDDEDLTTSILSHSEPPYLDKHLTLVWEQSNHLRSHALAAKIGDSLGESHPAILRTWALQIKDWNPSLATLVLATYEPTVEYLALLPELAKEVWSKRQDRAKQNSRALNIRLQEQKHLNSQAIKAKLKGELSEEDFADLKQNITEETAGIENALNALESERSTMEELIAQTQRELIDLPAAWKQAGLSERRELWLCEMLFPNGLVWGHEWGFLNSKNTSIMQDLRASWLDESDDVKIGVPTLTQFAPYRLLDFIERFTRSA
jgi:hypothetical protein